uniref:Uncharacterized protein n=1 Tax=Utricularia reniformis TaxID=192314 RepID=A0A1Y0B1K0_9LAMI|nr:hypothetical protein AEK19_MT1044 [Utricularia reniformis]ART31267.1 hypothetical protein AEK19_MT1044 [Utricularia reniformis]
MYKEYPFLYRSILSKVGLLIQSYIPKIVLFIEVDSLSSRSTTKTLHVFLFLWLDVFHPKLIGCFSPINSVNMYGSI